LGIAHDQRHAVPATACLGIFHPHVSVVVEGGVRRQRR